MPKINGNNSSNEGGNIGKNRSVAKGMKGHKLAQRLPHLSPLVDGTLTKGVRGRTVTGTSYTSAGEYRYTIPEGVDELTITLYGGGGAGGAGKAAGRGSLTGTGAGGGGGAKVQVVISEIAPRTQFTFTVGTGGMTQAPYDEENHGGTTSFTYNGQAFTAGGGVGPNETTPLELATGGTAGRAMGSSSTNIVVTLTQGMTGENWSTHSSSKGGCGGISRAGYGSYGQGGSGHNPTHESSVHTGRWYGQPGAVVIT